MPIYVLEPPLRSPMSAVNARTATVGRKTIRNDRVKPLIVPGLS
jgi:hypothetical protein